MSIKVEVISRRGCHLCEVAEEIVRDVQQEVPFELEVMFVDGDVELESKYGEEVPVTLINGRRHDYFRVDRLRFKKAIIEISEREVKTEEGNA